ncbi:MAG: S41 family peptidase [Clostridia bacterium]|nr:S41 family peptidase [Clostridia bacterium]
MDLNKRQKVYKVIMLVVIVATITFIATTLLMYQHIGGNVRYVTVSSNDGGISSTLASFRKIIDQKFLGDIDEEKVMQETIRGYIKGLDDPYTEYMTKEEMQEFTADVMGNFTGIGVYLTKDSQKNAVVVISPIKDTPAHKAGILPGDIITKVDGVSYTGEQLTEASNKIRGELGTKVKLEIIRDNKTLEFEITRENIKINHVEEKVLENNIGYIEFNSFDEGCSEEFKEKLEELKNKNITSLIIDIRNNGGGLVDEALEIADYIVEKDKTLLITVDKNNNENITKSKKDPIIDVPIVLLINENSASASEILAGALKDNGKATIVGEKSYGKGVIQELLTLTDGSGLKITTNEYFTPNRNKINEIGITPDIEVVLSDELKQQLVIEEKDDTQLQKAIETVKQK